MLEGRWRMGRGWGERTGKRAGEGWQGCRQGLPWWNSRWLLLLCLLGQENPKKTQPDHGTTLPSATQLERFYILHGHPRKDKKSNGHCNFWAICSWHQPQQRTGCSCCLYTLSWFLQPQVQTGTQLDPGALLSPPSSATQLEISAAFCKALNPKKKKHKQPHSAPHCGLTGIWNLPTAMDKGQSTTLTSSVWNLPQNKVFDLWTHWLVLLVCVGFFGKHFMPFLMILIYLSYLYICVYIIYNVQYIHIYKYTCIYTRKVYLCINIYL